MLTFSMWQNDEVCVQSMKMLKVRAALEEKLKQKGVFSSITPKTDKPRKLLKPLNGYQHALIYFFKYACTYAVKTNSTKV